MEYNRRGGIVIKRFWKPQGKEDKIDAQSLERLNRHELQAIIDEQIDLPWRKIDSELLRRCYALLKGPEEGGAGEEREKRTDASLQALRKRIRQEEENKRRKACLSLRGWRLAAAMAAALLLLFAAPLIRRPAFRGGTSPDGQDYIVMGIAQNRLGAAEADMSGRPEDEDFVMLNSPDEIPDHFGYRIALPGWLPEGCGIEEIAALCTAGMDMLDIIYGREDRQVRLTFTYNRDISGTGSYYEQDGSGKILKLDNGAEIYTATNVQSLWGLYQEEKVSYHIDVIGYDEDTMIKIFNSI